MTVSAARSPQEEADGAANPTARRRRGTRSGCAPAPRRQRVPGLEFRSSTSTTSWSTTARGRAGLRRRATGTTTQTVYVYAVDDDALRGRPRRRRQPQRDLADPTAAFDAASCATSRSPCATTTRRASTSSRSTPGTEDNATVVIEGTATTRLTDELRRPARRSRRRGRVASSSTLDLVRATSGRPLRATPPTRTRSTRRSIVLRRRRQLGRPVRVTVRPSTTSSARTRATTRDRQSSDRRDDRPPTTASRTTRGRRSSTST